MLELERLADEHGARPAIEVCGSCVSYAELLARVTRAREALAALGLRPGERVALACPHELDAIVRALACLAHGAAVLPLDAEAGAAELARQGDAFGARWFGRPGQELAPRPPRSLDGDEPPVLRALLSSGSSGAPKLVRFGREPLLARMASYAATLGLGPNDRVLGLVSLAHGHGFDSVLLATLSAGACLVLPASWHPRDVADEITARGITLFSAPPVFLDLMVRAARGSRTRLDGLRFRCHSVGDALATGTWQSFGERFGVAPWQSYGASEAGPVLLNRSGAAGDATMALGRPYQGVEVELCDAGGEPVAEGELGEIVVRSAGLAFPGRAEGDDAGRIQAGRFFTADLGVRRAGEIHFAGRRKLLIAVAGRKVSPEEVEQTLCRHPAVAEAAVLARRERGHEAVAALVVARQPVAERELLEFCARSLAPYKVPRSIELRAALPRNAAGKLLRDRLA